MDEKKKRLQFIYTYGVFILNGMLALSIGSMMPFIRESRGLTYAFCGSLVSLHSVGNFISSFFAGTLALKLGRKRSILLFNACFALAYLIILISPSFPDVMIPLLVVAFFMTGLARGATSNFCNTVINDIAPGKAAPINGLHAMFSVGAFAFPLLLMAITKTNAENWIIACVFMLIMGVLSWAMYALNPVDNAVSAKNKDGSVSTNQYEFFKEPIFYLTIVTLFFYLCTEQGVIGWLVTYFKDTELLSPALAQVMASVQWVMILAGRLSVAFLSTRFRKENMLPVMGLGLVAFFIVLITSHNPVGIVIGIMGFGFSMAGIYPTTVSFSGDLIKRQPLAWSFILTLASFGSIVMPWLIGRIAESAGIVAGMSSVAVAVAIDFVCIIALRTYLLKQAKNQK